MKNDTQDYMGAIFHFRPAQGFPDLSLVIYTNVTHGWYRHCRYDFVVVDLLAVHPFLFVVDFDDDFRSEFEAVFCPFCFPC